MISQYNKGTFLLSRKLPKNQLSSKRSYIWSFYIIMNSYLRGLIGGEVTTENSIVIGRIRNIITDPSGNQGIGSLEVISSCILPIPEKYRSVYVINSGEIKIYRMEDLVVCKGIEKRLTQLSVGLVDRFFIRLPFPRKLFSSIDKLLIEEAEPDGNSGTSPIAVRPKRPNPRLPDASIDW
jgi:hypothetical protein